MAFVTITINPVSPIPVALQSSLLNEDQVEAIILKLRTTTTQQQPLQQQERWLRNNQPSSIGTRDTEDCSALSFTASFNCLTRWLVIMSRWCNVLATKLLRWWPPRHSSACLSTLTKTTTTIKFILMLPPKKLCGKCSCWQSWLICCVLGVRIEFDTAASHQLRGVSRRQLGHLTFPTMTKQTKNHTSMNCNIHDVYDKELPTTSCSFNYTLHGTNNVIQLNSTPTFPPLVTSLFAPPPKIDITVLWLILLPARIVSIDGSLLMLDTQSNSKKQKLSSATCIHWKPPTHWPNKLFSTS